MLRFLSVCNGDDVRETDTVVADAGRVYDRQGASLDETPDGRAAIPQSLSGFGQGDESSFLIILYLRGVLWLLRGWLFYAAQIRQAVVNVFLFDSQRGQDRLDLSGCNGHFDYTLGHLGEKTCLA